MGFRLGFLLFGILFLGIFLFASFVHYKRKFNDAYKIGNHFPYEINYDSKVTDNGLGNLAMILMVLGFGGFFATFELGYEFAFYIPIIIAGIISVLVVPFLFLVPLKYMKAHIAIVMTQIVTSVCLPGTIGIAAFRYYQLTNSYIALAIMIVSIGVALAIVILTFNPRLSLRMDAEKKVNENGETIYLRPKWIPLALTEWILFFSLIVDAILVFILMLA